MTKTAIITSSPNCEIFKNELKNLGAYNRRIAELNEKIEDQYYILSGLKAIDYEKESGGGFNESAIEERRLELIERINAIQRDKRRLCDQVEYINTVISMMDQEIAAACIDIYVLKRTYDEVSRALYMGSSTLAYKINGEIEKAIIIYNTNFERIQKIHEIL